MDDRNIGFGGVSLSFLRSRLVESFLLFLETRHHFEIVIDSLEGFVRDFWNIGDPNLRAKHKEPQPSPLEKDEEMS